LLVYFASFFCFCKYSLNLSEYTLLPWTAYEFNHGSGPRVEAFLLRSNVDLKNRRFKTDNRKNYLTGQRLIFKGQGITQYAFLTHGDTALFLVTMCL
jgi:hypothetical protein